MWLNTKLFMHVHKGSHASPRGPHFIELQGWSYMEFGFEKLGVQKTPSQILLLNPKLDPT